MSDQPSGTIGPAPATSGGRPVGSGAARCPAAAGPEDTTGSSKGPLATGVGLVVLGLLLLSQVFAIRGEGLSPQGPRFFPMIVVTLLTALAVIYVLQQVRALLRRTELLPAERFSHLPAALVLVGLLVGYAFVLAAVGYVLATAAFFVGAARTMGSRHLVRDVVVGIGLALLVYLTFTRALGVFLPEGVLPL